MKKKTNGPFMNLELKTAAVHKSFSGNVTLAMFLSSHGDGFGADYEVPLVHESFSANAGCVFFRSRRQVLAQTIKYLFLRNPFVPLRQPHMENRFRCVHMHGLRVSAADK